MLIQVFGTGCPKCRRLAETVEKAAREANVEYELEKVVDLNKIVDFGIIATPALAIDGVVKSSGRIPSSAELANWLTDTEKR